jgi:tRNA threonylcarbamoyladenosine biosynthesis protein TsaE
MGFDEYFDAPGICCIEWSERIVDYLPKNSLYIELHHVEENVRLLTINRETDV